MKRENRRPGKGDGFTVLLGGEQLELTQKATETQSTQGRVRPCPPEFDATYIERGYDECEEIFRAGPMTVKRWLIERGSERLRAARAEHIAGLRREDRKNAKARKPTIASNVTVFATQPARDAANYLRTVRNGGWFVALSQSGEWWVGTRRLATPDMIAFAERKGFQAVEA